MLLNVKNQLDSMKLPITLMNNVMVTGGNTITPYFNTLVQEELASFSQENRISMNISTNSDEIASKTSWIGGAILGSLLDFDSFYISK